MTRFKSANSVPVALDFTDKNIGRELVVRPGIGVTAIPFAPSQASDISPSDIPEREEILDVDEDPEFIEFALQVWDTHIRANHTDPDTGEPLTDVLSDISSDELKHELFNNPLKATLALKAPRSEGAQLDALYELSTVSDEIIAQTQTVICFGVLLAHYRRGQRKPLAQSFLEKWPEEVKDQAIRYLIYYLAETGVDWCYIGLLDVLAQLEDGHLADDPVLRRDLLRYIPLPSVNTAKASELLIQYINLLIKKIPIEKKDEFIREMVTTDNEYLQKRYVADTRLPTDPDVKKVYQRGRTYQAIRSHIRQEVKKDQLARRYRWFKNV